LSGEIRPVPNGQERIKEAAKHGFRVAIVPEGNKPKQELAKIRIISVKKLGDVLAALEEL
jgi:DNA repair protein RadA/Sms